MSHLYHRPLPGPIRSVPGGVVATLDQRVLSQDRGLLLRCCDYWRMVFGLLNPHPTFVATDVVRHSAPSIPRDRLAVIAILLGQCSEVHRLHDDRWVWHNLSSRLCRRGEQFTALVDAVRSTTVAGRYEQRATWPEVAVRRHVVLER
jgi:hypothetical protein